MLFGVHNQYNNNSGNIGDFKHPLNPFMMNESTVRLSKDGIVIFQLGKREDLKNKIALAQALDEQLKETFGNGISFATCAKSDCIEWEELVPFYYHMRHINPDVVTIFSTDKRDDKWDCPRGADVNYMVDRWEEPAERILEILNASENNISVPEEGWKAYEERLVTLHKQAEKRAPSFINPVKFSFPALDEIK